MDPISWKRSLVQPTDIIDGVKSIEGKTVWAHSRTPEDWLPAETFYEWARVGLSNDHAFGWDIAVSLAKRAVCRRIDGFLWNNWLEHLVDRKYPEKIRILCDIGIAIPGIVHRLVIGSRNEIEHGYRSASGDEARDALDVAHLMLSSTALEASREPVAQAGGSIQVGWGKCSAKESPVEFYSINGLGAAPIVFVDFMEIPTLVKLVYPMDHEIRYAELSRFQREDSISFAKSMRTYNPSNTLLDMLPTSVPKELLPTVQRIEEFKRQTGI